MCAPRLDINEPSTLDLVETRLVHIFHIWNRRDWRNADGDHASLNSAAAALPRGSFVDVLLSRCESSMSFIFHNRPQ